MARKLSPKALEAIDRALGRIEQSRLAISRRKGRLRHAEGRFRVRRMMEMAGKVIHVDLALVGDPVVREAIASCRADLAEVKRAREAAGIPVRERAASQTRQRASPVKKPAAPNRADDVRRELTIAFRKVPPLALRNRLKALRFRYDPDVKEWRGRGDLAALRSAIVEAGAEHLLLELRVDTG